VRCKFLSQEFILRDKSRR